MLADMKNGWRNNKSNQIVIWNRQLSTREYHPWVRGIDAAQPRTPGLYFVLIYDHINLCYQEFTWTYFCKYFTKKFIKCSKRIFRILSRHFGRLPVDRTIKQLKELSALLDVWAVNWICTDMHTCILSTSVDRPVDRVKSHALCLCILIDLSVNR